MSKVFQRPCPNCGGEGCIDSGGVTPWGSGIDLPCEVCNGTGRVEINWKDAARDRYILSSSKFSLDDVIPFGEPVRGHFPSITQASVPLNLYLDDARDCPPEFKLARTYEECIEILSGRMKPTGAYGTFQFGLSNFTSYHVSILSLDHDLGTEKTGYDVACWIEEQWANGHTGIVHTIYLHTANPTGRDNMYRALAMSRFKPDHVKVHRSPMSFDSNFGGEW